MITGLAIHIHSSRSHGGEFSWLDYYTFQWAWNRFRWWAIPIYIGFAVAVGAVKAALGIGDD